MNLMGRCAVGGVIWSAFSLALAAGEHDLDVSLAVKSRDIVVSVKNVSSVAVPVTQIELGGKEYSGLQFYIYDPITKRLHESFSTAFPSRSGRVGGMGGYLAPGESKVRIFSIDNVERYFFSVPDCYYLVSVYRERVGVVLVSSGPSSALYICRK